MPYDVEIGDGADALGQNQLTDALDGTYWVSGWDATLGTGDLEVDIAAGSGAVLGGDVSSGSTQTVDFTGDPDPDDPRKAVISIDDTGTVQKTLGNPAPAGPSDEIRFRTFDPAPPASVPGVAVAEVWLAAGETVLETADIRDRRVANQAAEDLSSFSIVASDYSDESPNRSFDTTYTNTTGGPLKVKVGVNAAEDNTALLRLGLSVEDSTGLEEVEVVDLRLDNATFEEFTGIGVEAIVPAGNEYQASALAQNPSNVEKPVMLDEWYEQEIGIQ